MKKIISMAVICLGLVLSILHIVVMYKAKEINIFNFIGLVAGLFAFLHGFFILQASKNIQKSEERIKNLKLKLRIR